MPTVPEAEPTTTSNSNPAATGTIAPAPAQQGPNDIASPSRRPRRKKRKAIKLDAAGEAALLARLSGYFRQSEEHHRPHRKRAARDRDYYDGQQWSEAETAELLRRGQAPIVVNRIKPKIDTMLGLERRSRTDAKLYPRNPSDEQAARAATQAVRYVLDDNRFDQARSQVFEHLLIEGTAAAEVVAEPSRDGTRIRVRPIPWERLFIDPHARRRDLSDARFRGQVIWLDLDEAQGRYPAHKDRLSACLADASAGSEAYGDGGDPWVDSKRRRVRVIECWYRQGERIMQTIFCKSGLLAGPFASPYTDEEGRSHDPYVFAAAFITRKGERYGTVRQLVPIQDEINKRRSKALHLLSVRQVRAEKGAVEDVDAARRELARPDGYIETVAGLAFEVLPTGDMARAQFELLSEAKGEIDQVGANAALSGKVSEGTSGRAIQARQQSGQLEVGAVMDTLRNWQTEVVRRVWGRIRQYWTAPRWVRITDDENSPQFVGLNQPITLEDAMQRELGAVPPEMQGDPRLQEIVGTENRMAALDVDIQIGEVPDTVTLQQEEFRVLADLARSGVAIPPAALIEASGIQNKQKILSSLQ